MPFQIIRNDITKVKADAIINTANPFPQVGAGTDSAVYHAAGKEKLLAERKKIGLIQPGEVAVTPAFDLNAKYIIHTVGPAWNGGNDGEFDTLRSCYKKSLEQAHELKCKSVAFPLIATGVYGFPKADALQIAMQEISGFLMRDDVDMTVKLVVFDNKAFRLTQSLFTEVETFIDDGEVVEAHRNEYGLSEEAFEHQLMRRRRQQDDELYDYMVRNECADDAGYDEAWEEDAYEGASEELRTNKIILAEVAPQAPTGKPFNEQTFQKDLYMNDGKDELSFQNHLMKLIIEKNLDNTTVYKSSNVTKGAFSKILCGDTKKPQKKTVLGFCIGLKLNIDEAEELLASADMAFNPYNKRDRLVIQCILHGQYNIDEVNAMLFLCEQPLLGN